VTPGRASLDGLATKSPLSLHVALAQIRLGAALPFEEAMRLELRLAARFMAGEEFFEGVRALLVDKDKRPRWRHADLDSVPAAEVDELFGPPPAGLAELRIRLGGRVSGEGRAMAAVGFVGLGNMGLPMARNLLKGGHRVRGFDLSAEARGALAEAGGAEAASVAEAVRGAEVVVTMLPEGRHVRSVYLGEDGVLANAGEGALLVDCSTIDVETSRAVHGAAATQGSAMVDAPVSGGVPGAEAATLTFMVGGSDEAFGRARPVLERMGKAVIHTGPAGNGQAAKICNNMLLGIHMISVAEAFGLAERLGLAAEKLFEVSSRSSGQCWSLTSYCPVPGLVPARRPTATSGPASPPR
jgi:3-hydroxyisobutyrate dehydrogenase